RNHCSLAFVQMTAMEIGTQHEANWIIADVRSELERFPKLLTRIHSIAAIENFVLIGHNVLLLLTLLDVFHECFVRFGIDVLQPREDVGKWMSFGRSLLLSRRDCGLGGGGSAHRALPSTIARKAASHSLRSQRLEPGPTLTGRGYRFWRMPR